MENSVQFYPADGDITVLDTEYIFCMKRPQNFVFSKGDQDYCTMPLILGGTALYTLAGREFTVQPGDILFFPPHMGYTARVVSKEPWEHIVIAFRTGEDPAAFPLETVHKTSRSNRFRELFRQAYEVWSACAFGYKLQTKAIISQILFELLRENVSRRFGSDTGLRSLKAVSDYMEQNYREKITVEELAERSGYSASHFARQFTRVYGLSPIQYLNSIRILHAKNLLRTGQYTIAEIAQECGFSNVYYFSRCFKQLTGTPPTKW